MAAQHGREALFPLLFSEVRKKGIEINFFEEYNFQFCSVSMNFQVYMTNKALILRNLILINQGHKCQMADMKYNGASEASPHIQVSSRFGIMHINLFLQSLQSVQLQFLSMW